MTSQKTILLCTIGSAGDVYPFIAIGQRLKERGFRVVLITSEYFKAHAHTAGLEFFGLGSVEDYRSIIQDPDLWSPDKGFKVFAERVVFPIMEPAYQVIAGFDPSQTVLIAQGQFFAAHIAHEKLGIPFITVHLQPAAFRSVHDFPLSPIPLPPFFVRGLFRLIDALLLDKLFAPNINRFRLSLGLPAIQSIFGGWMHSPQLNLGLFPEWFAQPQTDWTPNTQLTGFVFYDPQQDDVPLPPELESFLNAGSPPVIFTAGTAMKHGEQFFRDCAQACQMIGQRGILLTQHPEQLSAQLPDGVQHFSYVPFGKVLPRALALVHHGGIGTTAQAIAAGIPQVIRPMAHDQPDTAMRVARLGIGLTLDPKRFNAESLARALDQLVSSAAARESCKALALKIHPEQALNDTCDLIEEFSQTMQ